MSIITDALKKAETERESKAKSQTEESSVVSTVALEQDIAAQIESESVLIQNLEINQEVPVLSAQPSLSENRQVWKHPVIWLAGALVVLALFVLMIPNKQVAVVTPAGTAPKVSAKTPYVLTGITQSGNDRFAIINGIIVQAGDSIGRATVKQISEHEVTLSTWTGDTTLSIES